MSSGREDPGWGMGNLIVTDGTEETGETGRIWEESGATRGIK